MESETAVKLLSALAQESRLSVFRLLVRVGPQGLPAGQIAERLGVPANTLSFHLKELSHAGLVSARPRGRFVIYAADFATMNGLIAYLTENCCGGNPCDSDAALACSAAEQNGPDIPAGDWTAGSCGGTGW
ncbi:MAG: metalloregulator ArsR/SmtB family transcription factor [Nitrococcus sp.]|nr:metalloregulator ArsR/SmtB family transcription factor [Nitrococcus sp.]